MYGEILAHMWLAGSHSPWVTTLAGTRQTRAQTPCTVGGDVGPRDVQRGVPP
eukprot:COSAG02_NODE_8805_length_2437_cov_7.043199_4_plen_51_part_01